MTSPSLWLMFSPADSRRGPARGFLAALALTVALPALPPLAAAAQTSGNSEGTIPDRPEELTYPDFVFETPDGTQYRRDLAGGIPMVIVEDRTLPLIRLGVTLRIGGFLDPADRIGLASLTAAMMRDGGAGERTPEEFDERIEFLAATISTSSGDTEARASLSTITPVFEESLDLFFEVLRNPRFDAERFEIRKRNVLEDLKQRNDDADDLLNREWALLLYGEDHHLGRQLTTAPLEAVTPDELRAFHRRYWRPEHMVFAASGDVEADALAAMIEERLADWPEADEAPAFEWPPTGDTAEPAPGIYHLEKDIPQGKVRIGHLSPRWDDWENPERAAIQVMDHILGASGFTSRLMQRIRSDEGLAYGAGGRFGFNPLGPSRYTLGYQSKSETVALAAAIALEEVGRIREEPVSEEELALARTSLTESFPRRFETARARASLFANDVFLGRSHDYWMRWREQVEAVTPEAVLAAARKYLEPERMVMLVVGVWEDIEGGDPEGRANMAEILGGTVEHLPERDPLTLEPIPSGTALEGR